MSANLPRPGEATRKDSAAREMTSPATPNKAHGTLLAESEAPDRKHSRAPLGKTGRKPTVVAPDDTNPEGFYGFRNLECPQYLRCLDQAVRQSWPTFNCQHCFHQKSRQPLRAESLDLNAPGWVDIWVEAGWEA